MLGLVDVSAGTVLGTVDLTLFLLRQFAAVRLPIRRDSLVDTLLLVFEARGLPGFQVSIADALGDAVLLVFAPLSDFVVAVVGGVRVVLVVVDAVADPVLLAVDLLSFLLRQLAAVGLAIVANFTVQVGFAAFKILGLARVSRPVCTPLAMRSCWSWRRSLTQPSFGWEVVG